VLRTSELFSWHRALSLRTRILLLLLPLMLALAGLVFEQVADMLEAELEASARQRVTAAADYVAHQIDSEIRLRIAVLSPMTSEIGAAMIAAPRRALRSVTEHPIAVLLFSQGLVVTDRTFRVIAEYPHANGRLGALISDREYAQELATGTGYVLGRPKIGTFTGKPTVALGTAIYDAHRAMQGLLLGVIGLEDPRVFGAVDKVALGASAYSLVVSPRDRLVVVASDKGRMLQALPAPGADPLLDRRVSEGYEGTGLSSSWNGVESITASRRISSSDWMVVTGIARAEVLAPAQVLRRSVYLWGLLALAGFVLILHLVLRRELLPLARATRAMKEMTEGDASLAPVREHGAGEIGQMITSFNSLVAERGLAEERLRLLNAQMEQRVDERTLELTEANEALNKEVSRRSRAEEQAKRFSGRLKEMTQRFVRVEEKEKRRLARELHDRVSSSLMAVGLSIGLIRRDLGRKSAESLRERLADTAELVKDTMLSAREISSDMHPASLDYDGLYGAIEDYARKFTTRTGLPVQLNSNDKTVRLAPEKETALFRIVQEALMNCAKHARAKQLEVSLEVLVGRVVLTVADDGEGFDADNFGAPGESGEQRPGLGLLGMGERAEAVAGDLQIESRRGHGTRVTVAMATSLI